MDLHQVAAARSRVGARRGVPFRYCKARILSNEAESSQDMMIQRRLL